MNFTPRFYPPASGDHPGPREWAGRVRIVENAPDSPEPGMADLPVVFSRSDPLGQLSLRSVDPCSDANLLHDWLTHPKSVFWQLQQASVADVERVFTETARSDFHDAFLGYHDDQPAFLVERYDPRQDPVGGTYAVQPGDMGMHFLLAPTDHPVHGFSRAVIVTAMEFLFSDPGVRRVVVEPDVHNTAVHTLNAWVGFYVQQTVRLPDKDAYLSFCPRERYYRIRAEAAKLKE